MFSKYTILFAENFSGQYIGLADALNEFNIGAIYCKNEIVDIQINLLNYKPAIIVFNSSELGLKSVKELVEHSKLDNYSPILYNIYSYGDDEKVQTLQEMGVKINIGSPYNTDAVSSHLKVICEKTPINKNDFRELIHHNISEILTELNVGHRCTGRDYIIDCIMFILFKRPRKLNLNGEVYVLIAHKYNSSLESVERAIRLAVESSWRKSNMDIKTKYFSESCFIKKRPTNSEFMLQISENVYNEYRIYFDKYYRTIKN